MRYEYFCDFCKEYLIINRAVDNRNILPECVICEHPMRRLLSRSAVLICNRMIDEPEVKYFAGRDAKERLETIKHDDVLYARNVAKRTEKVGNTKKLDEVSSDVMAKCMEQVGL